MTRPPIDLDDLIDRELDAIERALGIDTDDLVERSNPHHDAKGRLTTKAKCVLHVEHGGRIKAGESLHHEHPKHEGKGKAATDAKGKPKCARKPLSGDKAKAASAAHKAVKERESKAPVKAKEAKKVAAKEPKPKTKAEPKSKPKAEAKPKDEPKAKPALEKEHILDYFDELAAGKYKDDLKYKTSGLIPIHAIREEVREKHGEKAASHAELDKVIKEMHWEGKIKMLQIADNRDMTQKQLDDSVPGMNDTFAYIYLTDEYKKYKGSKSK